MAIPYLELRSDSPNKKGEHAIRIVIGNKRTGTGYSVLPKFWDEKRQQIKPTHPNAISYNAAIARKLSDAKDTAAYLAAAGKRPKGDKVVLAMSFAGQFCALARHYAQGFRMKGKIATARRYESIANVLEGYFPKLKISDMDNDWADEYRARLDQEQRAYNTIVSRLKLVKTILNNAEREGIIPMNQMRTYKIGSYRKTGKEVLTQEELNQLLEYKPTTKWEQVARVTFLFSFYATGARFKDVLLMAPSAIREQSGALRLVWKPYKTIDTTGEEVNILINARLKSLIDEAREMSGKSSPTLFGLIDTTLAPDPRERQIEAVQNKINRALKMLMLKLKIAKSISFHCARHSFAQIAKERSSRDVYTIKEALGHGDLKTTEFYLGKDLNAIDAMTKLVYLN